MAQKKGNVAESEKLNLIDGDTSFGVIEAYKTLRANLQFVCPHPGCRTILFTSSIAHEGKSSTSLNTAFTIAETGHRVLLIDADMRASHISYDLSLKSSPGLADLLAGTVENDDRNAVIQKYALRPSLDIVVAGKIPPNPSELLGSPRMVSFLEEWKKEYDYIIIDGTPLGIVSDVLVLSTAVDGFVVVVRADMTSRYMLHDVTDAITRAGGKTLGFVLNGIRTKGSSYGKYGKYGKYGDYGNYGSGER